MDGSSSPDIEQLMQLFTEAVRQRIQAAELENEALKMRLNEARVKLELAKERLEGLGGDVEGLSLTTNLK